MAARLHRIGSIYSRTSGCISKGLIKDRPIWFNVYEQFPPKYEPKMETDLPKVTVRDIFYEEDILRAEIHKICAKKQELIDLRDGTTQTESQKLLKTCQEYISSGMSKEDALKKIRDSIDSQSYQQSNKSTVQKAETIILPKTPT